jgi:hypothetical protein
MMGEIKSDATTQAWFDAVLDALVAADEMTRLGIARILCPTGFEIVADEVTSRSQTLASGRVQATPRQPNR